MEDTRQQIEEIVNRETRAWDTQDVDLLMTVFHPDMVWPWPRTPQSHDPMDWVLEWGRYDYDRWKNSWQNLFDTHRLARNDRVIRKIEISNEGDGAFASPPCANRNTLRKDNEYVSFDWRLSRAFRFGERYALIPTAEMFNTFNRDNRINALSTCGNQDSLTAPSLFDFNGFLRQGVGDPRQVQLSIKFTF